MADDNFCTYNFASYLFSSRFYLPLSFGIGENRGLSVFSQNKNNPFGHNVQLFISAYFLKHHQ
jgi:hypothetical protein